jgi:hypothetical protein
MTNFITILPSFKFTDEGPRTRKGIYFRFSMRNTGKNSYLYLSLFFYEDSQSILKIAQDDFLRIEYDEKQPYNLRLSKVDNRRLGFKLSIRHKSTLGPVLKTAFRWKITDKVPSKMMDETFVVKYFASQYEKKSLTINLKLYEKSKMPTIIK